jgi:hypothetical protein
VAGSLIQSAKFNNTVNDLANNGLSFALTKDGQQTATANQPMGGFRHTGVGAATAAAMYARVNEAQDGSLVYGGTAGGTADALTITTVPSFSAYTTGMTLFFKSGASPNTGAATLQVNGIAGPKALQKDGSALIAGDIAASKLYTAIYDGVAFQLTRLSFYEASAAILKSIGTTKGDIISFTASATPVRKGVGSDGFNLLPSSGATDGLAYVAPMFQLAINATIPAFSTAGGALTLALKTQDGGDPADAAPVFVTFRHATVSNGTFTVRKVAAALSMVVSSGSTLGHASAVAGPVYHYLIDNSGTIEYAVSTKFFGNYGIASTTAEGGAGAADSQSVMYSTTARANVPFVCFGRTNDTQTVAGTWATAQSETQLAPFAYKSPTRQVITTTGANTYTKPWDMLWAEIEVQGGGAASGSSANTGADQVSGGGGGGAGGYSRKKMNADAIGPTETMTVGVAAATSSFGAHATANGGAPGTNGIAATSISSLGGLGGTASGGDINITGGDGDSASGVSPTGAAFAQGGHGGDSVLGSGGRGASISAPGDIAGQAGHNYGGGGGGPATFDTAGVGQAAAAGAQGIGIVTEYYA